MYLDTDVPCLPQSERSFRISRVRPAFYDKSMRLFRNIVLVDIDASKYTQTKFKFARNVYSAPQMIMTIQSPVAGRIRQITCLVTDRQSVDFFTRAEMNREVALLKKKHNKTISAKVGSMFDCDIWMPDRNGRRIRSGRPFLLGFYQPERPELRDVFLSVS